jgi:GNAT superfamily N-acetyltransferase
MNIRAADFAEVVEAEEVASLRRHLSPRLATADHERPTHMSPRVKVLVADDSEQRPVGMITLVEYEVFSGLHGWLEDLVVEPAARERGLGARLMQAAVEAARSDGVEKLLSCSHPRRVPANRAHLAAGFGASESNLYRLRFG